MTLSVRSFISYTFNTKSFECVQFIDFIVHHLKCSKPFEWKIDEKLSGRRKTAMCIEQSVNLLWSGYLNLAMQQIMNWYLAWWILFKCVSFWTAAQETDYFSLRNVTPNHVLVFLLVHFLWYPFSMRILSLERSLFCFGILS